MTTLFSLAIFALLVFSSSHFEAHASTVNKDAMTNHGSMTGMDRIDSPIKQAKNGVLPHDIQCGKGYDLIIKAHDNFPACVRPSTASILVMRGWAADEDAMKMKGNSMQGSMNHPVNDTNLAMASDKSDMHAAIDESQFRKAPSLVGITGYINTTPDELQQQMKGKVVLYDFWTFNCINCIHTLPHMTELDSKYAGRGLLIIGIHTPETFFEKDPQNVMDAVEKFGIKYPVVLDNSYGTWSAFGNTYWPRQYLVDQNGYIRYDHIGEGDYDEIESQVQSLLAASPSA